MFVRLVLALALCATAATNAAAAFVEWYGYIKIKRATAACPAFPVVAGDGLSIFHLVYRHPGLGDNGPEAVLTMLGYIITGQPTLLPFHFYTAHMHTPGPLTGTFQTAKATYIHRDSGAFRPKIRLTSQTPEVITATTDVIDLKGNIKNFLGIVSDCDITFQMLLVRADLLPTGAASRFLGPVAPAAPSR